MFRNYCSSMLFPFMCWSKLGVYKCLWSVYQNYFLQDYHWWWRSFLTSAFTSFYLFLYCVHYFKTRLNIEGVASTFLYFGYTFIMVFLFFLMTGKLTMLQNIKSFLFRAFVNSLVKIFPSIKTLIQTLI